MNRAMAQEVHKLNSTHGYCATTADLKNISSSLARLKKHYNLTIGLTHGVFNNFHPGHFKFITRASEMCSILIVAIDSDEKPLLYKNPSHRLQSAKCRRLSLQNRIPYVHTFINALPFNERSYQSLYVHLHTDLLFIGKKFGAYEEIHFRSKLLNIPIIQILDCLSTQNI